MAINPIWHYSFESIPTVYDEEALTVLELCARLGRKVNELIEVINGMGGNVTPNPTPDSGTVTVGIKPTGDTTGEADRALIQAFLDAGANVWLVNGEYYLNAPLMLKAGSTIHGESQLLTVVNCSGDFVDHEEGVSCDHVELRDLRVKGSGSGVGINIARKTEGTEDGGRYAHFLNVYVSDFETGAKLGGCWCTNFTHCRFEGNAVGVNQLGTCNHIKYDHCMFLGPTGVSYDDMTAIGLKIGTANGAENYGISVDHCDFERLEFGINAYCCVALNVSHLYVEWTRKIFELDTCPNFLCDGGYASGVNRVCNTKKTNTAAVFAKCYGTIKNLFLRVDRDEDWYMVSTASGATLKVENISCINDGTGTSYVNQQHTTGLYNGHENATIITTKCSQYMNLTSNTVRVSPVVPLYVKGATKRFKIQSANLSFDGAGSLSITGSCIFSVYVKDVEICRVLVEDMNGKDFSFMSSLNYANTIFENIEDVKVEFSKVGATWGASSGQYPTATVTLVIVQDDMIL